MVYKFPKISFNLSLFSFNIFQQKKSQKINIKKFLLILRKKKVKKKFN